MAVTDAAEKAKKRKARNRIVAAGVVAAVIAAGIGGTYALNRYSVKKYLASDIEQETDFSAHLKSNGKIDRVNVSNYLPEFDISQIEVNADDVSYTDEDLESEISYLVESYRELSEDTSRAAANGDALSITYTGTVDGEKISDASDEDHEITLGDGDILDEFDENLKGAHPGDDVTFEGTYAEDYGNENLDGKTVSFTVHLNGIYETPEFDDEFVQENLSDSGYATAEEYRKGYKEQQIENLYSQAIDNWVIENVTLDKYPEVYLHYMKGIEMTYDAMTFNQLKTLYETYGMTFDYDSYQDYFATEADEETGTEGETYEEHRDSEAKEQVTRQIVYQKVFEDADLKITDADYQDFITKNEISDEVIESYGKAYIMQCVMDEMAMRYMQDKVTVVEPEEPSADSANTTADSAKTAAEAATETVTE